MPNIKRQADLVIFDVDDDLSSMIENWHISLHVNNSIKETPYKFGAFPALKRIRSCRPHQQTISPLFEMKICIISDPYEEDRVSSHLLDS